MNTLPLLIKAILAGAWRQAPPVLSLSAQEIAAVAPRLLETGAGGLGWWRVSHSDHACSRPAIALKQAYRLHTLQAELHEVQLQQVLTCLQSAGIEPLL